MDRRRQVKQKEVRREEKKAKLLAEKKKEEKKKEKAQAIKEEKLEKREKEVAELQLDKRWHEVNPTISEGWLGLDDTWWPEYTEMEPIHEDGRDQKEKEKMEKIEEIQRSLWQLAENEELTAYEWRFLSRYPDEMRMAVGWLVKIREMAVEGEVLPQDRCEICNCFINGRVLKYHKSANCFVDFESRSLLMAREYVGYRSRCYICSRYVGSKPHTCQNGPPKVDCAECLRSGNGRRRDHRSIYGSCQSIRDYRFKFGREPTMAEAIENKRNIEGEDAQFWLKNLTLMARERNVWRSWHDKEEKKKTRKEEHQLAWEESERRWQREWQCHMAEALRLQKALGRKREMAAGK